MGDVMPEPHDWLSPTEAATQLQVNRSTIRRWIAAGVLPAKQTRPGGTYRLERAVVERFAAEQQVVHPTREARRPPNTN